MHATVCGSVFGCEFGRVEGVGEVEGMKKERERWIDRRGKHGGEMYDTIRKGCEYGCYVNHFVGYCNAG